MERIVFFGKGGIGKSTTASNISAVLASAGNRVLHVGCDPKHDSTVQLLRGTMIEAVVDKPLDLQKVTPEDIVVRAPVGVDCVEAGGPEAGVGCGGRGISRMLEIFQAAELLTPKRYDVTIFDVLGDVVCGGFASPLKKGVGDKLVIVTSEEVMSLYAANNIARAAVHYQSNGVRLAGLVVNLRDNATDRTPIEHFARHLGTQIIGYIPRDAIVREAEYRRMTAVEFAPASPVARIYKEIADRILALDSRRLPLPTPFDEKSFYHATQFKFALPQGSVPTPTPTATSVASEKELVTLRRPEPLANRTEQEAFARELAAGRKAVALGRVHPDDAVWRLRNRFPVAAANLSSSALRESK